ncbi:NUDIX domain-containing protein [Streptomyces sp900116325]|uniref:NUDIX domain-containing protein n=1 Tax=Streptomyces sp. 900116325 TaxID=3154295 RepID=A0ABV2U8J9_9ACTN
MTDEPRTAGVRFDDNRLVLEQYRDDSGIYYSFPGVGLSSAPGSFRADGRTAGGTSAALSLTEALHARIRPVGTAENVLRAWSQGAPPQDTAALDDPTTAEPTRVRGGAIVIRDRRMLLIHFPGDDGCHYEIPGGGVEADETPEVAAVRELREETGLHGTVVREVARIWRGGTRGHYFTMEADGEVGAPETLDNYGGAPAWVPVSELPTTPLWPRRLSWRIAHWHSAGWPASPAELADSVWDLDAACGW